MEKRETDKIRKHNLIQLTKELTDELELGKTLGRATHEFVDEVKIRKTKYGLWEATIFFTNDEVEE